MSQVRGKLAEGRRKQEHGIDITPRGQGIEMIMIMLKPALIAVAMGSCHRQLLTSTHLYLHFVCITPFPCLRVVFLYRRHEAEVNELPSLAAWEECDFSQAQRLCEHWQGEGVGCGVEVRGVPRFLTSDINDCMMGQKVSGQDTNPES